MNALRGYSIQKAAGSNTAATESRFAGTPALGPLAFHVQSVVGNKQPPAEPPTLADPVICPAKTA
jgi:hypothetical protein